MIRAPALPAMWGEQVQLIVTVGTSIVSSFLRALRQRATKIYGLRRFAFRNPPRGNQPVGSQAERKLRDGVGDSVETLSQQSSATAEGHCSLGPRHHRAWEDQRRPMSTS